MIQTLKNYYHLLQAISACVMYRNPSRELAVIGVTGTDGKTTTVSLIYHILTRCGKKASMISSVYAKVAGKEYDTGFHVTSPSPWDVQRYLRESADYGDDFFVLETTSHGIDQHRVWGVQYAAGVITNVTHEHLDYHKNYENYVRVKSRLLERARISIANADDRSFSYIKSSVTKPIVRYAIRNTAEHRFDMAQVLGLPLAEFNKYNYLAAYAVCRELGLGHDEIVQALKTFKLPTGRVEVVTTKPCTVIVDFAHTPNSIEQVLKYMHTGFLKKPGRIIHVFGSAAKRDAAKRPLMGDASAEYSDLVILTEEDYRTEDPVAISRAIASGLEKKGFREISPDDFGAQTKTYTIIISREDAIRKALSIAGPKDVVILTGKGHEKSLCRGRKEYPWSDSEAVKRLLKSYKST